MARTFLIEKDRVLSTKNNRSAARFNFHPQIIVADDNPLLKIGLNVIPEAAIEFLKYKSLTIAGVEQKDLLDYVLKKLIEAERDGIPFEEWNDSIDEIFDNYGITKLNSLHAETVFRTNNASAYSFAAEEQAQLMIERFPLYKFVPIHDDRSRHIAYEGIYEVGKGPLSPLDFNCRCGEQYLHVSESAGLKAKTWNGTTRFNSRESFDEWKNSKNLPDETTKFIENQLLL